MLEYQGDGKGSEWKQIFEEVERIRQVNENPDAEVDPSAAFGQWNTDGFLASSVFVPKKAEVESADSQLEVSVIDDADEPSSEEPPESSNNGE